MDTDESRQYGDSAYPLLLADVLEYVLQHAGQPDQAAYALSEQICAITGARLVTVVRHDERGEHPSFTVYPERRKAIAESPEARAFFRLAAQTGSVALWDAQSQDPVAARLLSAWHLTNCMSLPLFAGTQRMGTLFILDFSFTGNIDSLIRTMDTMSRVLGLILRNASFYQEAELLVQERTRALEAANAALEKAKFQAELYLDLMSHDIRNYNQIALGFLEFAMDTMDLDEGERELISKPIDAVNSSSRLIDNVVKLQKVSSGKGLEDRPVDLCEILARITASYSHIPDRQVTINYSPIAECTILANDLIYDVFNNIIGNAIKHTDPGKLLTVGIRMKHQTMEGTDYLMISIEDDGPGIPDELKGKLFSRREKGRTKASGRGLGLFLVRTLVDDFGGAVWVEDRVAGDYRKGARFVVALPAASNVQL